jgi:hypothetical protein
MCELGLPPTFECSRGKMYSALKDWQTTLQTDGENREEQLGKVTIMRRAPSW